MKTAVAVLLAFACVFVEGAHAGFIDSAGVDLPGASTGIVGPVGATPSPNNDDAPGVNPNVVQYALFLNSFGTVETVFAVTNSAGATEYVLTQTLVNNSGVDWAGFRFELGFGSGSAFSSSGVADGLDFDAPSLDPLPVSSAFADLAAQADVLSWSGGLVIPVGATTFRFSIDVPDNLSQWHPQGLNAFTLRQVPVTSSVVAEPAMLPLLLLGIATALRLRRVRA